MGRPRTTPEQAAEKLSRRRHERLIRARDRHEIAQEALGAAEIELRKQIDLAVKEGASYRDVGLLLGMPHQSVHQLVKPYERAKVPV